MNNFEPNKLQQRINGRIAMRAVAKATDLPRSFALPFCNLWLGSGAHLVHYPINDGKDVNLVLTFDAKKVTGDWQREFLVTMMCWWHYRTIIISTGQTPHCQHKLIKIVGDVGEQCWPEMQLTPSLQPRARLAKASKMPLA